MLPLEEAWCRNRACALHGESFDDADLLRCPACHHLLALAEVRLPVASPTLADPPREGALA